MKHLIFGLALLVGFSAKAQDVAGPELQEKILTALIKQANSIVVYNEDGSIASSDKQLPSLLSKAIMRNYQQLGKSGELSDFSLTCEIDGMDMVHVQGGQPYSCYVSFGHGNFVRKGDTLINQDGQDEAQFVLEVAVPDNTNYDVQIVSKSVTLIGRPAAPSLDLN